MDFPASKIEYERWESMGSAMMYKDHALIVPEVSERRGQLMSKSKLKPDKDDAWSVDVELHIGNEAKTEKGGNGVGIFYLIDADKDNN